MKWAELEAPVTIGDDLLDAPPPRAVVSGADDDYGPLCVACGLPCARPGRCEDCAGGGTRG